MRVRIGRKYKKCCGRFTLEEMTAKLAAYAAANKQKNKLIERSLEFLKSCEIEGGRVFLVLVNPVIKDDIIDWAVVGDRTEQDVREAIVTRRILAGYLPLYCLVEDKSVESGWRGVIDAKLLGEDCRDEFVAFALNGGASNRPNTPRQDVKGRCMDGSYAVGRHELSGMPLKPRPAGTIRIEVKIPKRTITIASEPLRGSMEIELHQST